MVGYLILRWCIILSRSYVVVKSLISVLICCYLVVLNKTPIVCCPGCAFKNKLNLISSCPKSYLVCTCWGAAFTAVWFDLHSKVLLACIPCVNFYALISTILKLTCSLVPWANAVAPCAKRGCFCCWPAHCIYANAFVGCQPMPMCLSLARVDHH